MAVNIRDRTKSAGASSLERYGIEKDRARRDLDDWYSRQTWD
jgi:uncharacterized protein YjbJ (UPF0337 family)